MLLNYLFTHFHEEKDFALAAGFDDARLQEMLFLRVIPKASYELDGELRSVSFVSNHRDKGSYRFHLKAHCSWLQSVDRLSLDTETRARVYFFDRYNSAKARFLSGPLGSELTSVAPSVPSRFDPEHAEMTWGRFLDGVYGVCTRDGQPETVFLKQAGMMFIEQLTASGPDALSPDQLDLLKRTVSFLDGVESDFAPHEIPLSSRQRCINDVRSRFFTDAAA